MKFTRIGDTFTQPMEFANQPDSDTNPSVPKPVLPNNSIVNTTITYNVAPAPVGAKAPDVRPFSEQCAFCLQRFEGKDKREYMLFLEHEDSICKKRPKDRAAREQKLSVIRRKRRRDSAAAEGRRAAGQKCIAASASVSSIPPEFLVGNNPR